MGRSQISENGVWESSRVGFCCKHLDSAAGGGNGVAGRKLQDQTVEVAPLVK
uniref:Uncharacterized protein n=1 Tax=Oryza sativa subsp. japonica TaxID=39947 RepID=Q6K686_ORYSJ|nr:hypothetical protein [Oryza sativa Japonica Group]BAD19656.1 hypothetical protein [Oryza sativa Japonica Group]